MKGKHILFLLPLLILLGAPVNGAEKGLTGDDKAFIKEAASGGMMEVQLGEMAQQKGQSRDVKDFGARMVKDHTKANEELKALAGQKNEKLPDKIGSKHQKVVDKLSKAAAADFDKQYMQTMVKDHATDVSNFKNVSVKGNDTDLKALAAKTLPVLEDHLKQASDIAKKMGIDVDKAQAEGLKEAKKYQ
jgi:putative membrane protein